MRRTLRKRPRNPLDDDWLFADPMNLPLEGAADEDDVVSDSYPPQAPHSSAPGWLLLGAAIFLFGFLVGGSAWFRSAPTGAPVSSDCSAPSPKPSRGAVLELAQRNTTRTLRMRL